MKIHDYNPCKIKQKIMKKSIFLLGFVASLALASCNGTSSEATTGADTTTVAADTTLATDTSAVADGSSKADTSAK